MVDKIMYISNETMIRKLSFFNFDDNDRFIQSVATKLRPEIYLPFDYLIYKNDAAEEMYFLIEGTLDLITKDNKRVEKTLEKGCSVGEVALISHAKRAVSVIASSFSLVYRLNKQDFEQILSKNEEAKNQFMMHYFTRTMSY
jgi:CRP-like cAMP-binding protein